MLFTAPIWLTLLMPLAIFVAWLLQGQRKHIDVPFLDLWKAPFPKPSKHRALRPPAIPLATGILAILLAILAAAGPTLRNQSSTHTLTIIVDHGLIMSARGRSSERFKELAQDLSPILLQEFGDGPVRLVTIPSGQLISATRSNWSRLVLDMPATAIDTQPQL